VKLIALERKNCITDTVSVEQGAAIRAVIAKSLSQTAFHSIASDSDFFRDMLRLLRTALVDRGFAANRRHLAGPLLENLHSGVLASVYERLHEWLADGHSTVCRDGWQNVTQKHIVNSLVAYKGKVIFLRSLSTEDINQTSANQETALLAVLSEFGGVNKFGAIASDSKLCQHEDTNV
jgi:hypothetical protein